jgi:ADP-heptose:LPS heptosyltransferase
MLATPLLAALSTAFPDARFDWAASDWTRPAVAGNRRLTDLIPAGKGDLERAGRLEIRHFIQRLRREQYDTCFIPAQSSLLSSIAWRAGIRQRVGLNVRGRGFAHTIAVRPPPGERQLAVRYLALATAVGVRGHVVQSAEMEFDPADADRTAMTRWLIEELDWLGDRPLVILHPGGGVNPRQTNLQRRWPAERFARLAGYLIHHHEAIVVLVGAQSERGLANEVAGMIPSKVVNQAGALSLGEIGALCELAGLYVGNDTGPTYVAAATSCPTLAIFGPSDPAIFAPYRVNSLVTSLWHPYDGDFSWDKGVMVEEAMRAADVLLM